MILHHWSKWKLNLELNVIYHVLFLCMCSQASSYYFFFISIFFNFLNQPICICCLLQSHPQSRMTSQWNWTLSVFIYYEQITMSIYLSVWHARLESEVQLFTHVAIYTHQISSGMKNCTFSRKLIKSCFLLYLLGTGSGHEALQKNLSLASINWSIAFLVKGLPGLIYPFCSNSNFKSRSLFSLTTRWVKAASCSILFSCVELDLKQYWPVVASMVCL